MLEKMVELESELNRVKARPMDEEKIIAARTLRLQYVKGRTGTATLHKDITSEYLAGGRMVDGWKNTQLATSHGAEKDLK